jgi:hypothetical protein
MISYFRARSGKDCTVDQSPAEYMLDLVASGPGPWAPRYDLARLVLAVTATAETRQHSQGSQGNHTSGRENGYLRRATGEALCV